jgi:hypothetical protein
LWGLLPGGPSDQQFHEQEHGGQIQLHRPAHRWIGVQHQCHGSETFDFGVAQSDRNYQAYNGLADWEGKPVTNLRSVFSMHPETVMLVPQGHGDQKGGRHQGQAHQHRQPGSGQRFNAEEVLRIYGIDKARISGPKACSSMRPPGPWWTARSMPSSTRWAIRARPSKNRPSRWISSWSHRSPGNQEAGRRKTVLCVYQDSSRILPWRGLRCAHLCGDRHRHQSRECPR